MMNHALLKMKVFRIIWINNGYNYFINSIRLNIACVASMDLYLSYVPSDLLVKSEWATVVALTILCNNVSFNKFYSRDCKYT